MARDGSSTASDDFTENKRRPTPTEYRAWLLTLPKSELAEMVIEARAVTDYLRGQWQYAMELVDSYSNRGSTVANDRARLGGFMRHIADPKGKAKLKAHNLWRERHEGKHPKLRTNEQFATECMRRWPVLTSSAVITGWCTEWNKAAKARKS